MTKRSQAESTDAYPLHWPVGWPRTVPDARTGSQFSISLGRARDELMKSLARFEAQDVILSTDVPVRRDGLLYASSSAPDDPGCAVYFTHAGQPRVIACDAYLSLAANLRACWATVEALRTLQRHGTSQLLDRAFMGFKALPPGPTEPEPAAWWDVLGVLHDASPEAVKTAYRKWCRELHPDRLGGDATRMVEVNRAYAEFEREQRHES